VNVDTVKIHLKSRASRLGFAALAVAGLVLLAVAGGTGIAVTGATPAAANACNSGCLAAFNRCRIRTNNSPSCRAQLQACVRRCIRR
jgi:hypothetical protein